MYYRQGPVVSGGETFDERASAVTLQVATSVAIRNRWLYLDHHPEYPHVSGLARQSADRCGLD